MMLKAAKQPKPPRERKTLKKSTVMLLAKMKPIMLVKGYMKKEELSSKFCWFFQVRLLL